MGNTETMTAAGAGPHNTGFANPYTFYEDLSIKPRQLWWLPGVLIAALFGMGIYAVPVILVSFIIHLVRYRRALVALTATHLVVGNKSMPLAWLDAATIGTSRNLWPWQWASKRRIACVPFWTRSSLGISGIEPSGRKVHVSAGTNQREALLHVLLTAIPNARQQANISQDVRLPTTTHAAPGWYPDPWNPTVLVRWFDGNTWTAWTAPTPRLVRSAGAGSRGRD